jgi:hypothetical protein
VNPDGFSAAPALVRKTAEAAKRSPGTALNFVVEDGSADETVLGAVLAAAAELASRLRRSGLRTARSPPSAAVAGRVVSEAIVACTPVVPEENSTEPGESWPAAVQSTGRGRSSATGSARGGC